MVNGNDNELINYYYRLCSSKLCPPCPDVSVGCLFGNNLIWIKPEFKNR